MAKGVRLETLASEAGLDVDEALVTLWEIGLEDLDGPEAFLAPSQLSRARRALGLPKRKDFARSDYWRHRLQLSDADFDELLAAQGIRRSRAARNLPKGAIAKLQRLAKERTVHPPAQMPMARVSEKPAPPFEWITVGRARAIKYITLEDLLGIHNALVEDFQAEADPIFPPGPRDIGLVASSAGRPHTAMGDVTKYESVEMAAAALVHSIVLNHGFHNGNKRTALVAMLVFLDENDLMVTCAEDELFRLVLKIAQHKMAPKSWDNLADRETIAIAQWIKSNTRHVDRSEKLIKWHQLRQILNSYGCELRHAKTGNRMNIEREVESRGLLGIARHRRLKVQVFYGDEGRQVERDTLKHLRQKLELDDDHGIDSAIFYAADAAPADFIAAYRKTLKRLAKL